MPLSKYDREIEIGVSALEPQVALQGSPANAVDVRIGFTFMTGCAGILDLVDGGEEVQIDFQSGAFTNHTRGIQREFTPLPERALEIIRMDGTEGVLKAWWAKEQQRSHGEHAASQ